MCLSLVLEDLQEAQCKPLSLSHLDLSLPLIHAEMRSCCTDALCPRFAVLAGSRLLFSQFFFRSTLMLLLATSAPDGGVDSLSLWLEASAIRSHAEILT